MKTAGFAAVISGIILAFSATGHATITADFNSTSFRYGIPSVSCTQTVSTTSAIQSALDNHGSGAVICLAAGTYRLTQPLTIKSGQTLYGESGAYLDGSVLLTSFTYNSGFYHAKVPGFNTATTGQCLSSSPECVYPNDVYFDNVPLKRVATLSDVHAGDFYLDTSSLEVYISADPSGHKVEYGYTTKAINGYNSNVTVEGLHIEKFANAAQTHALETGSGWTVKFNEVNLNHGGGIGLNGYIYHNYVHDNGEIGMSGGTGQSGIIVDTNEIAYNNYAGYNFKWEGGGTKFWKTNGTQISNNYVHSNNGPGLWCDTDNKNITYEYNTVENNASTGIMHEISYNAVIKYNTISGNGFQDPYWGDGCGIQLSTSSYVSVYGNTLSGNHNGICMTAANRGNSPTYGTVYLLEDNAVSGNSVQMSTGYTGVLDQTTNNDPYHANNTFKNDTYSLGSNSTYFYWEKAWRTYAQWKAYGND